MVARFFAAAANGFGFYRHISSHSLGRLAGLVCLNSSQVSATTMTLVL